MLALTRLIQFYMNFIGMNKRALVTGFLRCDRIFPYVQSPTLLPISDRISNYPITSDRSKKRVIAN